jgi:hypothetical protein
MRDEGPDLPSVSFAGLLPTYPVRSRLARRDGLPLPPAPHAVGVYETRHASWNIGPSAPAASCCT